MLVLIKNAAGDGKIPHRRWWLARVRWRCGIWEVRGVWVLRALQGAQTATAGGWAGLGIRTGLRAEAGCHRHGHRPYES